jgi:hypothetical protein
VTAGFALDFGCVVEGIWTYRDPAQQLVARAVQEVLEWDLRVFDAWLFGRDHWRNFPRIRQRLISLREQLSHACHAHGHSSTRARQGIHDYFRETRRLALQSKNLPEALRAALVSVVRCKETRTSTRLDAKSRMRIRRMYQELVESGQKYGAQTRLARQYGVSRTTIQKVVKGA